MRLTLLCLYCLSKDYPSPFQTEGGQASEPSYGKVIWLQFNKVNVFIIFIFCGHLLLRVSVVGFPFIIDVVDRIIVNVY